MRKVLVLALALVMLAGVSAAGNVSRGFEKYVSSMQGSDEITVLVVLQDQVDVAALDWQLHNAKSSMEDRHAIVVGSLQDVSKRSQGRLLADLAASKALGEVKGYTSHWLVNSVVVRTTVEGARALALRDDVEIVEPNLEIELIEPASGPESKGFDKDTNGIGICPGVVAVGARRVWTELGINGMDYEQWFGVMGPANMPKPVVDKLAAAMDQVLRMPDVRERLVGMALEVAQPGPDEMKRKVEGDAQRWQKLAVELDIKPAD